MVRYTVVWHDLALDELAEIWNSASDRDLVSFAADEIDRQLADDPETKGNPVSVRSRELPIPPLHALFRIKPADRLVEVFSITRLSEDTL